MKSKLILACALVAIALSLCACAPLSKQASVEASCDEFMKSQHISKEVEVLADGSLTVTLCSNPSTGFQWSETAQISDQTVLQQTGHKYVTKEYKTPPPPGTPGQEVWTFKALKEGTSTMSLEYSRPWNPADIGYWTFKLTVTVK